MDSANLNRGGGARNPKSKPVTVRLTVSQDERLNALADAAGANKGVMASMCLVIGASVLEKMLLSGDVSPDQMQAGSISWSRQVTSRDQE